jgi:NhaP-type Na+/H+ or K+/H+ antiporter
MAAVAAGVTLGNSGVRDLGRLREFKEMLSLILLSFVFVLLAAELRVEDVRALGFEGLLVVAVLTFVCRPLSVFAATLGSDLSVRERLFMAWICPRGIVAVAMAGLFRILLDEAGIAGGGALQALVFVTVGVTVTLQGLTARPLARALGVDFPNLHTTIVIGADRLGRVLVRLLGQHRFDPVLLDNNPWLCRAARAEGFSACEGDALSVEALEQAGAGRADTVVALTRNPELNALVAQRVRENFRVERLLAWTGEPAEGAPPALQPFPGRFPGVDEVNAALRADHYVAIECEVREEGAVGMRVGELPWAEDEFALLVQRGQAVVIVTADHKLAKRDRLWCLKPKSRPSSLATLLAFQREAKP